MQGTELCVCGGEAGQCGRAPAPTCLSVPFAEWPEAVAPAPWEAVCRERRQCVGGVQVCRVCGVRACWGAGCAGMRDCRVRGCAGVRCAEVQGVRVQGCGAQRYRGAGAGVPRMGVGWRRQVLAEAAAASLDAGPTGTPPWLCPDSEAHVRGVSGRVYRAVKRVGLKRLQMPGARLPAPLPAGRGAIKSGGRWAGVARPGEGETLVGAVWGGADAQRLCCGGSVPRGRHERLPCCPLTGWGGGVGHEEGRRGWEPGAGEAPVLTPHGPGLLRRAGVGRGRAGAGARGRLRAASRAARSFPDV